MQGYIQFFRNKPAFVQLSLFYFALGQFTPSATGPDGWTEIPISFNVGWAIICLSFVVLLTLPFEIEVGGSTSVYQTG